MKEIIPIVIFSCLVFISCSKKSSQQIKEQLSGQWEYEAIAYKWDTIMDEISVDFDHPEIKKQVVVLKTDSGNYKYEYENGKLIDISLSLDKWIAEFVFSDDSSGVVHYYIINPEEEYRQQEHPRIFGNDFKFLIHFSDTLPIIEFRDKHDDSHFNTTYVTALTTNKLILTNNDGSGKTKYKRVNEP